MQESLRDLIESRAASHRIAPRTLRRWALEAIVQNALLLTFPRGVSLDTEFNHGGMRLTWRQAIGRLLHAIDDFDPFKFSWVRSLTCYPTRFDKWLATKMAGLRKTYRLPARKRAPDTKVQRVVQGYVNDELARGYNTSIPRMWHHVKTKLPRATYEQAVNALRAIEGGPKQRGRPRRGTSVRK
jgi:hypothetical protein